MMKSAHGIAEQKRSEEANKLFLALLDRASDGIAVIDPETGFFLDVNTKACLMHGYTREEHLAISIFQIDMTHAWDSLQASETSKERTQGNSCFGFDSLHRRKDGSTFPVEVNISFIRLERDYLLAVMRDITERKFSEMERERLTTELNPAPTSLKSTNCLLPICCMCKQIRDKNGGWQQIETYIAQRTRLKFSHTYCPECFAKWCTEMTKSIS